MDNNIDYILITTSDKFVKDEHNYHFIRGSDEYEALEQFLKENPLDTFSKMIIVPLQYCYKFIPTVDFPQTGDWKASYNTKEEIRIRFYNGNYSKEEVIERVKVDCNYDNGKNLKIKKMTYEN